MSVGYDDTNPPSSNSTSLGFTLTKKSAATTAGSQQLGDTLTYTASVQNKNQNQSLGLTVLVLRIPSCYSMNFELFEGLKSQGLIDLYEFKNGNTEVWMYLNRLGPGETKTFDIDLQQQYLGTCKERPSQAFEFYNPRQMIWVVPANSSRRRV